MTKNQIVSQSLTRKIAFFLLTALLLTGATSAQSADISLSNFAVGVPFAGGVFHYEYQIKNEGPDPSLDVSLRDFLPNDLEFVNAFMDFEGGTGLVPLPCDVALGSNVLFCPLGNIGLTGNVPVFVFVNVRIKSDVPEGTVLENSADVFLTDTPDPDSSNNRDSAPITVRTEADLEVSLLASTLTSGPSSEISFTVVVSNGGPSDAREVMMVDELPEDPKKVEYITDSGNGMCAYDAVTHTVGCDFGTVPAGESIALEIVVRPKGNLGKVTNTASAETSTPESNLSNNFAAKVVRIRGGRR